MRQDLLRLIQRQVAGHAVIDGGECFSAGAVGLEGVDVSAQVVIDRLDQCVDDGAGRLLAAGGDAEAEEARAPFFDRAFALGCG